MACKYEYIIPPSYLQWSRLSAYTRRSFEAPLPRANPQTTPYEVTTPGLFTDEVRIHGYICYPSNVGFQPRDFTVLLAYSRVVLDAIEVHQYLKTASPVLKYHQLTQSRISWMQVWTGYMQTARDQAAKSHAPIKLENISLVLSEQIILSNRIPFPVSCWSVRQASVTHLAWCAKSSRSISMHRHAIDTKF